MKKNATMRQLQEFIVQTLYKLKRLYQHRTRGTQTYIDSVKFEWLSGSDKRWLGREVGVDRPNLGTIDI